MLREREAEEVGSIFYMCPQQGPIHPGDMDSRLEHWLELPGDQQLATASWSGVQEEPGRRYGFGDLPMPDTAFGREKNSDWQRREFCPFIHSVTLRSHFSLPPFYFFEKQTV